MPTTCGFPNCKFRSRYRGSDDNRHFYRVPKKPAILRMRWLEAIGRTEETIVSQLRVCSGHFPGGEKKEGDVPVSDPSIDKAIKVELPPKSFRSSSTIKRNKRRIKSIGHGILPQLKHFPTNSNLFPNTITNNMTNTISNPPLLINQQFSNIFQEFTSNSMTNYINSFGSILNGFSPLFKKPFLTPSSCNGIPVYQDAQFDRLLKVSNSNKPTVLILDILPIPIDDVILGSICNYKYINVSTIDNLLEEEINFLSKANTVIYQKNLNKSQLTKFKSLKHVVKIGPSLQSDDVRDITEKNIALSVISAPCVDEIADTIICLILNLYRHTSFLTNSTYETKQIFEWNRNPQNSNRVRPIKGQTLGLIGLGQTGIAVAIRARVFGFNIKFYDSTLSPGSDWYLGLKRVDSLPQLLSESDCISVNIDPTCDFSQSIPSNLFGYLKKGCYFVNMSSVSAMKITKSVLNLIEDTIGGAVVNAANIEASIIDDVLEIANNKITVMPTQNDYSQSCILEMREQALYEVRRGLLNSSLECLRSCVNKTELMQKNRSFDKFSKSRFQSNSPDIETVKTFSVESLICNSKQIDVNMDEESS